MKSTISYLSNVPKTRLFGDNPQGGIGGQGDSQLRDYYDEINYRQRHELLPSLKQLTQIVCSILKIDYSKLNISFPSLWELTEQEKSDINLKNKQADSILTDNIIKMKTNMITPEDINNYKLLIDSMK